MLAEFVFFLLGCHCSFETNNQHNKLFCFIPPAPCIEYVPTFTHEFLKPFIFGKNIPWSQQEPCVDLGNATQPGLVAV